MTPNRNEDEILKTIEEIINTLEKDHRNLDIAADLRCILNALKVSREKGRHDEEVKFARKIARILRVLIGLGSIANLIMGESSDD